MIKYYSLILSMFFLLILNGCEPSRQLAEEDQRNDLPPDETLKADLDALLSDLHQKGKFNGNVLVVKNEQTLYKRSFGYADGSKGHLLSSDHKFDIGSIYKEFPAVAIMQLREQNRIDLSDKVAAYLSGFPKWAEAISIENLLQYSSGLPTIDWNQLFQQESSPDETDLLNHIRRIEELEFEPGTDYLYTNCSPILLIKIVESISGQAFEQYLNDHIFGPFHLEDIALQEQFPYPDKTAMAIPFDEHFTEDDHQISVKYLLFTATAKGLYEWFYKLANFEIITEQSFNLLSRKFKAGPEFQAPLGDVAFDKTGSYTEHAHHGSSGNYECFVRHFRQDDLTIVILTNQKHRNVQDISDRIYEMVK
jgi:CubicO group peptidase (beta-lactamase class C family)